jgi:amidohydrolase
MGARCEFEFLEGYPAVVNDSAMTDLLIEAASRVLGPQAVGAELLSMGGEDMAYFLQEVPGVYFFLGAGNAEKGLTAPHHSPDFDFDEQAMPLGAEIFLRFVDLYFQRGPRGFGAT